MKVPFTIVADFECFTTPIQSCEPSSQKVILIDINNTNRQASVITL